MSRNIVTLCLLISGGTFAFWHYSSCFGQISRFRPATASNPLNNTKNQVTHPAGTLLGTGTSEDPFGLVVTRVDSDPIRKAVKELQDATSRDERSAAEDSLKAAISEAFAKDLARRQNELEVIRKRVSELESLLEKRESMKEEIVELQLKTLIFESQGLGFSTSDTRDRARVGWPVPHRK